MLQEKDTEIEKWSHWICTAAQEMFLNYLSKSYPSKAVSFFAWNPAVICPISSNSLGWCKTTFIFWPQSWCLLHSLQSPVSCVSLPLYGELTEGKNYILLILVFPVLGPWRAAGSTGGMGDSMIGNVLIVLSPNVAVFFPSPRILALCSCITLCLFSWLPFHMSTIWPE